MLELRVGVSPLFQFVVRKNNNEKVSLMQVLERKENMLKKTEIEKKCEELVQPIVDAHQFELVDVEYVKEGGIWYLRAYIDKEGGITVNDCEAVAREMNEILDVEDFIPDSYTFEVSSPGLGRPLKKEKDYVRNMGKEVEIRTYRAINKSKEIVTMVSKILSIFEIKRK